jgi:hypothetical protein
MPDTECVSLPSRVSSLLFVLSWGAEGGEEYEVTVTDFGAPSAGTLGLPEDGVNEYTVISEPDPQISGHSMSDMALTYPALDGSVWIAGTGVKACVPSWLRRPMNLPDVKALGAGHTVRAALPCGFEIHSRSDLLA